MITEKNKKTKVSPKKTKVSPKKTKVSPKKTKVSPKKIQKGGNLLTDAVSEHSVGTAFKFYTAPITTGIYSMFAAKKAYDYNREYSIMSIDVGNEKEAIQLAFDPNVHGEWSGSTGLQMLYLKEYILKKFNNACSIPENVKQILLFALPSNNSVELIYVNEKLTRQQPNPSSQVFFKNIIGNCNKRFVIIPIGLVWETLPIGHANMLIIDKIDGTVEHFEPYGSGPGNILSIFAHKDKKLNVYKYLKGVFNDIGYAYLSPSQTCPLIGPQLIEELILCHELMIPQIKNKVGMCLLWSLFYVHLRLSSPDAEPIELINNAVKSMGTDLCKFIKGYAQTILEMSKKYNLVKDNTNGIIIDYT